MRVVPVKGVESQDLQNLHRARDRLIAVRTAVVNQARRLLVEDGVLIPQGITKFRSCLVELLSRSESELTGLTLSVLRALQAELHRYDEGIQGLTNRWKI
jgi:transposase